MITRWFNRLSPRSLFARALLILLLPVILLQLIVGFVFIQRHYEGVTEQMVRAVARDLNYAIAAVDLSPSVPEARALLDFISRPLGLALELDSESHVVAPNQSTIFDLSGAALIRTLDEMIVQDVGVDLTRDPSSALVQVKTDKGIVFAAIPRSRVAASNPHQLLVLMVFASLLLTTISILFLRNQVRPIRDLAGAAEEFGKGRSIAYKPRGAVEIRRAGTAFLAMRARLERQIEQRTQMLSGVSHDLRTPLTRLKLSLSMLEEDEEKQHLLNDITEMERMLDEFLAFAKGDSMEEPVLINPLELAQDVANSARDGVPVSVQLLDETSGNLLTKLRIGATQRALQNLVSNAQRYGSRVQILVRVTPSQLEFIVEDNGPGIAEHQRQEALKPFTQLDESRNQNDGGGVGLGLAIALDVARSHGGTLALDVSESLGGLKATLRLPR